MNGPLIILADTVISKAYEPDFGFSRPSAVEYDGDKVTALYFKKGRNVQRRVLHDGKQSAWNDNAGGARGTKKETGRDNVEFLDHRAPGVFSSNQRLAALRQR